jgi:SAM-dependent methyltransferase
MRDFTLPAPVDLILCELDALNHVPAKSDLSRVASAAARALRPGGHFFFDVNNRPCLKHLWPVTNWIDTPRAAVAVHGGYDPESETAWNDVEGFLRDGKRWRRRHARIEELCWSAAEIRRALTDAGFDRIRARDASSLMRGLLIIRRGYRSVYLARKSTSA